MISAPVKGREGRAVSRAAILADVRVALAGGAGTTRFPEPSRNGTVTLLAGPDTVAAAVDTDTVVDAEADCCTTDTAAASLNLRHLVGEMATSFGAKY